MAIKVSVSAPFAQQKGIEKGLNIGEDDIGTGI